MTHLSNTKVSLIINNNNNSTISSFNKFNRDFLDEPEYSKRELDEYLTCLNCSSIAKKPNKKSLKTSSFYKSQSAVKLSYSTEYNLNKTQKKTTKISQEKTKIVNFNETYERLIKKDQEYKKKIEKMKKSKLQEEIKNIQSVPTINKKSKELAKTDDDFLTRMKKNDTQLEEKKKLLEKNIKDKNNSNNTQKKMNKKKINESIIKMFEWDQIRKEKIEKQKKQKEDDELKGIKFKPQINKNSSKMMENKQCMVKTLNKEESFKMTPEKKKVLKKINQQSFA